MYVIKIKIDGMRCGQCEAHVKEKLEKIDGALVIKASHMSNSAEIISPLKIEESSILKALEGTGYKATGYSIEEKPDKGFFYKRKAAKYNKNKGN